MMGYNIPSRMRNIIFVVILILMLIWAGRNAAAAPHHGRFTPNRHSLHIGAVVVKLPPGSIEVRVGPVRCHYRGGVFYRKGRRGFVVVKAPVGAVVPALSPGFQVVIAGGMPYYRLQGVWYRRIPSGYVVADAPSGEVVTDTSMMGNGVRVTITTELLNVRAGPGTDHPILTRVTWGTVMTIRGQTGEWFYTELPNGTFGWVMKIFTAPDAVSASG